jgi:hypothetical protein
MNNVIVGELICALWDHWQSQRQIRLNITLPESNDQKQMKSIHEYDGNQSTVTHSRVPTSTVHEDRYMLSPLRL